MEAPLELQVPCLKMEDLLHAAMNHLISHQSYSDAIFLGERICGNFASETATKLLSNAYAAKAQASGLASGMRPQALGVLLKYKTNVISPINRYLHAKLLFDDGKLSDAEATLTEGLCGVPFDETNIFLRFGESAAFAFALSASICERTGRFDEAMRFSTTALRLNPFLWTTFRTICRLSHLTESNFQFSSLATRTEPASHPVFLDDSNRNPKTEMRVDESDSEASHASIYLGMYDELIDSLSSVVSAVLDEQRNAHLNDASAIIRWPFSLSGAFAQSSVSLSSSTATSPSDAHRLVAAFPLTCTCSTSQLFGVAADSSNRSEPSAAQRAQCVFGSSALLQPVNAAAACWRCLVTELVRPFTDPARGPARSGAMSGDLKADDASSLLPSKRRAVDAVPQLLQSTPQPTVAVTETQQPIAFTGEKAPGQVHSTVQHAPVTVTVGNAPKKPAARKPRVEHPAPVTADEPSGPVRTIVTRAATMRSANVKENKVQPPAPTTATSSIATRQRTIGGSGSGTATTAIATSTQSQQQSTTNVPAKRTKPSRSAHDKETSGRHMLVNAVNPPVLRSGRVVATRRDGNDREALIADPSAPVTKAAIGDVTNTPPSASTLSRAVAVGSGVGTMNLAVGVGSSAAVAAGKRLFPASDLNNPNANTSTNTAGAVTRRSNRSRNVITNSNSPVSGSTSTHDTVTAASPQQAVATHTTTAVGLTSQSASPASNDPSSCSVRRPTTCVSVDSGCPSLGDVNRGTTDVDTDARLRFEPVFVSTVIESRLAQLSDAWKRAVEAESKKLDTFCGVLKTMARAYSMLNAFRCTETLSLIETLPPAERRSRFALKRVALAHFEAREFTRACDAFEQLRREFPFSVSGLDTYSTALWYVQKGAGLSALAQQLLASHPHAPQTWIALANCFSLQRDAERTLTFLERSLKLKERAYTHALIGHELLNQGESTRARNAFSRATELDPRCYSALFGLGMLHLRADELAQAERCMRRAMLVTPRNSIVVCHLGVILHAQRRYDEALRLLRTAIELNPRDTMSRFHYASILFSLSRYNEARDELENVKQVVPNEPIVFYLLSKVYRKLLRAELAQLHVTWALDLDPKRTRRDLHEVCRKQFLFAAVGEQKMTPHNDPDSDDSDTELLSSAPNAAGTAMDAPLRAGSLLNQTDSVSAILTRNLTADQSLTTMEPANPSSDASSSLLATTSPFPFPLPTSSTFHLSMSASTSPTPNETDSDA